MFSVNDHGHGVDGGVDIGNRCEGAQAEAYRAFWHGSQIRMYQGGAVQSCTYGDFEISIQGV